MSKKAKALLCIITGSIVLVIGCSKSSEDKLTPPDPPSCDTANMTYSTDIKPILQANCYSCHGNGNAEGGRSLGSYESVKDAVEDGNLIGTITHAAGYPPMPQGGAKLSDCDINKIKAWINSGSSNN
jgi:mono/diheme cytochrome c family protein